MDSAADQVNVAKVYEAGQEQVFEYWDELNSDQRRSLLTQLDAIDFQEFGRLVRTHLLDPEKNDASSTLEELKPAEMIPTQGSTHLAQERQLAQRVGFETLRRGEVGILLVAGGQGTRLQFDGPKGLFPLGPLSGRTLFQYLAEKIRALQLRVKRNLTWIIMTSPANHEETVSYIQTHGFFGLHPSDVIFRAQGMLPSVDPRRAKMLLTAKHEIALSPNGHGGAIRVLQALGPELEKRGVRHIFTHQVDNPLVRMCDPTFVGFHVLRQSQFSSKAVAKRHADEKVGVFCRSGLALRVVEYTELTPQARTALDATGRLAFRAGNIAQHIISMEFLCGDAAAGNFNVPYHVARKALRYLRNGAPVAADRPNSVRFESFLFDAIPYAKNPIVVEALREREFAPVKNLSGEDSPDECRGLLTAEWARWFAESGVVFPPSQGGSKYPVEISPLFADSAEELRDRLAERTFDLRAPVVLE
ncbi:MAG: UTP--glucose-1-phosphate uridylyltransferase [Planctomycetota bacterium]